MDSDQVFCTSQDMTVNCTGSEKCMVMNKSKWITSFY